MGTVIATVSELTPELRPAVFTHLLRLGDDRLVLGHRLSEWCGHGPFIEEDIALANIALDCIGEAKLFLDLAGEVGGEGKSSDELAYFRDEYQFLNVTLVEQPNGDFAHTIVRQFFYDAFAFNYYEILEKSAFAPLAAIAEKSLKEVKYHLRHSREWLVRLGDGTEESRERLQQALLVLWPFTAELFQMQSEDQLLQQHGVAPAAASIAEAWRKMVEAAYREATLQLPENLPMAAANGRSGRHSEHLGHMLAEMQIVARSHPGASW